MAGQFQNKVDRVPSSCGVIDHDFHDGRAELAG
jgi:hypothetical protein